MSADLVAQFAEINSAETEDTFNAVRTHSLRNDFLGKALNGAPVFLISDNGIPVYRPEIRHRHLRVSFGASCRLTVERAQLVNQFVVVRFDSDAIELHEMFIRCVNAVMLPLPVSADTHEIEERVGRLLALFRVLSMPSSRELSGLWAELLCIRFSPRPAEALAYWHSAIEEKYDFSWSGRCAEVKSTTSPYRVHEFASEQLEPPPSGDGRVISIMLRPSNDGVGVVGLARAIEATLDGDLQLREKLWSQVLSSLGAEFSSDLDRRFDVDFALSHLAVFAMQDIPSLPENLDHRISAVRFRVDLSESATQASLVGLAGLRSVFE